MSVKPEVEQAVNDVVETLLSIRQENLDLKEALARVEAERDQWQTAYWKQHRITGEAQAQLAEAVGLLREVNSQRFTTLATVEIIESFIGRHSQTFHDRAQAEQQEAQCPQAGGERAAFEGWYRRTLSPGATFNKNPDGSYESGNCQGRWLTWQARAALAIQPAAIKLPDLKRTDHLSADYKTMTPTRASIESYNRALDDVAALNAVRGAEHE